MWRGSQAAMLRTGVGSSVQLSSYDSSKRFLLELGMFNNKDSIKVHFTASLLTGFFVCFAMNPVDVAMTRMVCFI